MDERKAGGMSGGDDRPLTRWECERCPLHSEVNNLKGWIKSIDFKFWALLILVMGDLIAKVWK